jgi:cysteine desulfurase / selenocysteine lyase
MIYLDNAATTFPKPPSVPEALSNFLVNIGGSPGRSTHGHAVKASEIIFDTREKLAHFFNVTDSSRIVYTSNATESINTVLFGVLKQGDRVITSSMEHNSVMRPLRNLKENRNIEITLIPCDTRGRIDVSAFETSVKKGARLAVVNHGSNICGTIQPIDRLGAIARAHGVLLLVDAAQTAGIIPINVDAMNIDFLAFSGHKALHGPQGTGGLYVKNGITVTPLKFGGTGSMSDSDEQPLFLPDNLESGTQNGPGIAGLGAGLDFNTQTGMATIHAHGIELTRLFFDAISDVPRIKTHGQIDPAAMLPTISFTINGIDSGIAARRLYDEFGICCRVGLHCAPYAHRTIGTFPKGTIRISFGCFNTQEHVEALTAALKCICR